MLTEEHIQLGGVFLNVAHVVEEQLGEGQLAPTKPAQLACLLIR